MRRRRRRRLHQHEAGALPGACDKQKAQLPQGDHVPRRRPDPDISAEQESQPADADGHRNIEDPSGAGISGAVDAAKVLLDNGPEIGEPAASAEFANMKHMQTEEVDA